MFKASEDDDGGEVNNVPGTHWVGTELMEQRDEEGGSNSPQLAGMSNNNNNNNNNTLIMMLIMKMRMMMCLVGMELLEEKAEEGMIQLPPAGRNI